MCTMNDFWSSCLSNFRIYEVYLFALISCTPEAWFIHNFILHQFPQTWFIYMIVHCRSYVNRLASPRIHLNVHENQSALFMWDRSTRPIFCGPMQGGTTRIVTLDVRIPVKITKWDFSILPPIFVKSY